MTRQLTKAGLMIATLAAAQPFQCERTTTDRTFVRAEGVYEPMGDLVFRCSGIAPAASMRVVFSTSPSISVTTRVVDASRTTEAIMLRETPGGETPPGRPSKDAQRWQGVLASNSQLAWEQVPVGVVGAAMDMQFRIRGVRANASQLGIPLGSSADIMGLVQIQAGPAPPIVLAANLALAFGGLATELRTCDDRGAYSPATFDRSAGLNEDLATDVALSAPVTFNVKFREEFPDSFLPAARATPIDGIPPAQGTRFILRFTNYPAGARLFVSTRSVPYGTNRRAIAELVSTDFNGAGPKGGQVRPLATAECRGRSHATWEVPVVGGVGQATWEITEADPDEVESVSIAVVVAFAANRVSLGTTSINANFGPLSTVTSASSADSRFVDVARNRSIFSVDPPRKVFLFTEARFGADTARRQSFIAKIQAKNNGQYPATCSIRFFPVTSEGVPEKWSDWEIPPGSPTGNYITGQTGLRRFTGCLVVDCAMEDGVMELSEIVGSAESAPRAAVLLDLADGVEQALSSKAPECGRELKPPK